MAVLRTGDALAIFTDGVTECGTSRREMFGLEGVTTLLGQPFIASSDVDEGDIGATGMAEAVALRLIAGVNAAAKCGVARDDVCLLVGVVEG